MRYTPEETVVEDYDDDDVAFMDRVLVAWAIDAHEHAAKLGYPEAGNIWGIVSPVESRKILNLDERQLMTVDREIVRLPFRAVTLRCRKLLFVEYFTHDPRGIKAQRFSVSVRTYVRRLKSLQQYLYNQLSPGIQQWPQRVMQRDL